MNKPISRRPQPDAAERRREYIPPRRHGSWVLRLITQLCLMSIFLAGGYYVAGFTLDLLDRKNLSHQEDVATGPEDARRLMASGGSDEALLPRKSLRIYPVGAAGMEITTVKVLAEVQEDEIMQAVREVFVQTAEKWTGLIHPRHVYRDGISVYIDLPRNFADGLKTVSEQRALLILTGLVRTVVENFPPIKQVYFLGEGRWIPNIGDIRMSDPWGFQQNQPSA